MMATKQTSNKDLILRDVLALDRTTLANQRTLLSFSRTGISLIVTSLAIFEFSDSEGAKIAAWGLIAMGSSIIIIGLINFLRVRKNIRKVYNP